MSDSNDATYFGIVSLVALGSLVAFCLLIVMAFVDISHARTNYKQEINQVYLNHVQGGVSK